MLEVQIAIDLAMARVRARVQVPVRAPAHPQGLRPRILARADLDRLVVRLHVVESAECMSFARDPREPRLHARFALASARVLAHHVVMQLATLCVVEAVQGSVLMHREPREYYESSQCTR